jgi:hypothetical protein
MPRDEPRRIDPADDKITDHVISLRRVTETLQEYRSVLRQAAEFGFEEANPPHPESSDDPFRQFTWWLMGELRELQRRREAADGQSWETLITRLRAIDRPLAGIYIGDGTLEEVWEWLDRELRQLEELKSFFFAGQRWAKSQGRDPFVDAQEPPHEL